MRGGDVSLSVGGATIQFEVPPVLNVTKHEIRDMFVGLSQAVDDNATELNQAIPNPARSAASPAAKAVALALVAFKHVGIV
jgi:hypothetical protein